MTLALLPNFIGPDAGIILLVVVVLFGAKKLPELARSMGASIREFQRGKDEAPADSASTRPPEPPKVL